MPHLNGLTLAYIGDAVYELLIRESLIRAGLTKVDHLHKEAIHYTSAVGQAKAYDSIESMLSENEISYFKKGRNGKTDRKARNASLADYKKATGFESLIGYLYLEKKQSRLEELLDYIIKNQKKQ